LKHQRRLSALITLLALPLACPLPAARSQDAPAQPAGQAAPDDAAARRELYQKFYDNRETDTKTAYAAAREYLTRFPGDDDQRAQALKQWVTYYERLERKNKLAELLRDPKTAGEAFALGKQILADDPEDLATQINTAQAGFSAVTSGNEKLTGEAAELTRDVIARIEAGKTPVPGQPFAQKDETLGWLHYALGFYTLKTNPGEAASHLRGVVEREGVIKRDPEAYALLGYAYYQAGNFAALVEDFQKRFVGKPETPESKVALERLYAIVDPIIDAYARAVAVAGTSKEPARYESQKKEWTAQLSELYKLRNKGKTDGLEALIAGVLAKPLPAAPPPAPAPPADPAKK
jgi:tetratricopeptide (TPR) repeat protein